MRKFTEKDLEDLRNKGITDYSESDIDKINVYDITLEASIENHILENHPEILDFKRDEVFPRETSKVETDLVSPHFTTSFLFERENGIEVMRTTHQIPTFEGTFREWCDKRYIKKDYTDKDVEDAIKHCLIDSVVSDMIPKYIRDNIGVTIQDVYERNEKGLDYIKNYYMKVDRGWLNFYYRDEE